MLNSRYGLQVETLSGDEDNSRAPKPLRGAMRLLMAMDHSVLCEFPLRNGRRADIVSLDGKGAIWIVEVKSGVPDFRSDSKWPEYAEWCDAFFFAVGPDFPSNILPASSGLIVADPYEGLLVRMPEVSRMAASRRKAMTLCFARLAATRLNIRQSPSL